MDAVNELLEKYGLEDPAEDNSEGIFTSEALQNLYNTLISNGSDSETAALLVGATIEDLDIYDLEELLLATDNADIQTAYQNLVKGSRNHMRSFVGLLDSYGVEYQPQYISQEDLEDILDSPYERGVYNQSGDRVSVTTQPNSWSTGEFVDADGDGVCDLYSDRQSKGRSRKR